MDDAPAPKSPKNRGAAIPAGEHSTLRERSAFASVIALGGNRVFGEDLRDPLERLLRGRLRRQAVLDDVHPALHKGMLVLDLRKGRVEDPPLRQGRAEQALLDIRLPVRVGG